MQAKKDKKLHLIGNAHIDPVWLWNWQEGFQEVKATFRSALDRMNEDENFIFTCSSAVFYEWVEKNNPAMFEEIKKRVQEGRWEVVGGWYIQPDCNIPSGESFVRQGLYSQRYFKEKLGVMAKTGYNVDSFGHSGMLPQILKKSGMENYVFMRPMPVEKGLPSRTFWWKSLDGSKVLSYRIPYEYCSSAKDLENHASRLKCELEEGEDELMMFYGVGNHGGGPTRENIRSIYEMDSRPDMPRMTMSTTGSFFDAMRSAGREFPVVEGDLQHHASGCYSVHSGIKRWNRRSESALIHSEKWSAISNIVENQPYPSDFKQAWQGLLFNQFHDTLAGTSIPSAYDDALYLAGEAIAIGQRNLNYALQAISWDIKIDEDVTMRPIVVFNSHCFTGKMAVELEVRGLTNDRFVLKDEEGKLVPAQRVQSEATVGGQSRLLFVSELPSMGYRVFRLFCNVDNEDTSGTVLITENTVENERYKLTFSGETGFIRSYLDKKLNLEILRRDGARLSVFEDTGDTWSHNIYKFDKKLGDMSLVYKKIIEKGQVRSTMRLKYKWNESYVIQDFSVYKEMDHVEVKMRIDWREPRSILKLVFPVNFNFRKPTYEIPYGYMEKSGNGEEEPGQSWIDFSGEHFTEKRMYGLAVANDSKYSYSFDVDEMAITLLKNSVYAHHDPKELEEGCEYRYVDNGPQEMTYLLVPHEDGWRSSDILKLSAQVNQKPITIIETFHADGRLPMKKSFMTVDAKEIMITAVKEAEDKDGVIIRAYEAMRRTVSCKIDIPFLNREITADFAPCEIKTFKVPYDESKPITEVNMLELDIVEESL